MLPRTGRLQGFAASHGAASLMWHFFRMCCTVLLQTICLQGPCDSSLQLNCVALFFVPVPQTRSVMWTGRTLVNRGPIGVKAARRFGLGVDEWVGGAGPHTLSPLSRPLGLPIVARQSFHHLIIVKTKRGPKRVENRSREKSRKTCRILFYAKSWL